MTRQIVLYGGSFNPPTEAHVATAAQLAHKFDRVVAALCGIRPDKITTNVIDPVHRAIMTKLAFREMSNVQVDTSDLERAQFLTTIELDQLWKRTRGLSDEIWHAVGSDLVVGGRNGKSKIQTEWHEGRTVWDTLNFVVLPRPGYPIEKEDLPPHAIVMPALDINQSSTDARERFRRNESTAGIVPDLVARHAKRFGLYAFVPGSKRVGLLTLPPSPYIAVVAAEGNGRANEIAHAIRIPCTRPHDADAIVAIGGDGHMLDVIRRYRLGIPIIGINAGNRGFLLNDIDAERFNEHITTGGSFETHLLPMLEVELSRFENDWSQERWYAFNDAWMERSTTQTAWVRVDVQDGEHAESIERLACDAVLVSTPAGSTAYARAMGAPVQRLDANGLTLAAAAVSQPADWRYAPLSESAVVTFTVLDPVKRPVRAVADGLELANCRAMRIRRSRTAAAELAFLPGNSLARKISREHFPR